jgi:hypothetical protein
LLAQKTNQKKAPEMTTSTRPCACNTSHIGATGRAEVRTISSLPSRRHLYNTVTFMIFLISNGLREFWEIATVLKIAAWALNKQYCLSDTPAGGERVVLHGQAEKQEPQNYLQP